MPKMTTAELKALLASLRTELRGMNERLDRIIEKFAQNS